jgi:hypothetical protein
VFSEPKAVESLADKSIVMDWGTLEVAGVQVNEQFVTEILSDVRRAEPDATYPDGPTFVQVYAVSVPN